jgi:CBS domain-containing protein
VRLAQGLGRPSSLDHRECEEDFMRNDAPELSTVPINEIMTTEVITTSPSTSIEDVASLLRTRRFAGVPVVNERGILVGMVSEFDVISKRGQTVEEIMSRGVISIGDEASAEQVTNLMGLHGIRRVPVVRDGKLVGIVSRSDLLRLFSMVRWSCQTCGDHQRGFTKPERCLRCNSDNFVLERERRTGEGF